MSSEVPYARLAGFYFFYYGALGVFLPYWSPYLQARGFVPAQIGIAVAVFAGTRIFAPVMWGWLADRWRVRLPVVRGAALVAPLTLLMPISPDAPAGLVLQMLLLSFCLNAVLPQLEVLTLNHLREDIHAYGRIRLWGSVGFIVAVAVTGPLLDRTGIEPVAGIISATLAMMGLASLTVPDIRDDWNAHAAGAEGPVWRVLRDPVVLALLAACLLSQMSFAPYYGFFSLYLEQHHYSKAATGGFWAVGVLAEIMVFFLMAGLFRRFTERTLMLFALLSTAVRWTMLALVADRPALLFMAQVLHFASFGIYHAVAIQAIHRLFPGRLQGRGQAFYSAASFGAGGAAGGLIAGFLWVPLAGEAVFLLAAGVAGLAWLVCWRWFKPKPAAVAG